MKLTKTKMKFLNTKKALIAFLLVFSFGMNAQEIIKEKVATDSVKVKTGKQKEDGISATVGDYIILD